MDTFEKSGKRISTALGLATCLPIIATIYGIETEPGWHGKKYISEDSTIIKGWQEINSNTYYFSEENGAVDLSLTKEFTTSSINTNLGEEILDTVSEVAGKVIEENIPKSEHPEPTIAEIPESELAEYFIMENENECIDTAEIILENESFVMEEDIESETVLGIHVENPAIEDTPVVEPEEVVIIEDELDTVYDYFEPEEQEIVEPEIAGGEDSVTYGEDYVAGGKEDVTYGEEDIAGEQDNIKEEDVAYSEEDIAGEQDSAKEKDDIAYGEDSVTYSKEEQSIIPEPEPIIEEDSGENQTDLNTRIVNAALSLVGVTDGMQCTEVVQLALYYAGVPNAMQLWPDQYAPTYGYYTTIPIAGNLIYYNNGGRGVDHIAIYIGNGMAVHGNCNGKTVIASVDVPGGAPQYIQVVE